MKEWVDLAKDSIRDGLFKTENCQVRASDLPDVSLSIMGIKKPRSPRNKHKIVLTRSAGDKHKLQSATVSCRSGLKILLI